MEAFKMIAIFLIGGLFLASMWGFSALKIYDEFRKAFEKKSRVRLWFAFSLAMFSFLAAIIVFTEWGIAIEKKLKENSAYRTLHSMLPFSKRALPLCRYVIYEFSQADSCTS